MRNFLSFQRYLFGVCSINRSQRFNNWLALFLLTASSLATYGNHAQAATPQTAPPQLKNLLTQIDAAANQHDVKAVMQFYGENFSHSDGLTRLSMAKALTELWQRYPRLKYRTQIQSWKTDRNAIVAETLTNITGAQFIDNRNLVINATIKSQQRFEGEKIVRQEILSERTQIKAGAKPPTVEVRLPQQVKAGQPYNFDVVVQEPLGDDYLLGAAIEEPIKPENYLNPASVELELLPAGGLFKLGRAPATADDRWISAVLIRGDGMTMVTQRLQVVGGTRSQKPAARIQQLRVKSNTL